MPPKAPVVSKKVEQKKKEKIIEDKTFGLKNKKGAKTQKYVQNVTHQIKHGNQSREKIEAEKAGKKKPTVDELRDLNKLLKPVADMPKVAKDVDPKSIVCLFFKQGMCKKGNKCKFSHDLAVEQKTAKKNLYVDSRDLSKDDDENMENWDETKLSEVAERKHGEKDRKRPNQTEIVCKYFLDAVEINKYGWFWECPNGDKCIYRHALPPGYILKKDKKKLEEQKRLEEISLEELIEKERASLNIETTTKVTLQTFIAWKKRKLRERKKQQLQEETKKKQNFRTGKSFGISGRDLFTYNPELVGQDEDDMEGGIAYERETIAEEDEIKAFEIDERTFYAIDEDGHMLDDDLDVEENNEENIAFNEDLFTADEVPDVESSDDEQCTSTNGMSQLRID